MKKFGEIIVKLRVPILIAAVVLLIPSALGYFNTRVNYDILSYLPGEIETMKGQEILVDEFGTGAFTMIVVEGMEFKEIRRRLSICKLLNRFWIAIFFCQHVLKVII